MGSTEEFSRHQAILAALRTTGRVSVTELASRLGVSTVTVRKDLDGLERRSLLRRVYGGAIGLGASDEGSFEMRLRDSRASKQTIARAAAELVHDGDVIALDASTTAYYLALELLDRRNLVVVTNGLRVAVLLMEQSTARVLLPGGVVRRSTGSVVGPIGDSLASRGRIAKGFFGLVALSPTHGLMDISTEEAQMKRSLADACESVFGLFDSSKVKGFGLHSFAAPSAITGLYTDDGAPEDFVAQWTDRGVPVRTVTPDPGEANVVELSTATRQRRHRPGQPSTSGARP